MAPTTIDKPSFKYQNGQAAFSFLPDGSGFAYYPSGRPAICVSTVSAYQNRFYIYDDIPAHHLPGPSASEAVPRRSTSRGMKKPARRKRETMLCALDENVIGFAVDSSGGSSHGRRMVFTKEGCLISEGDGRISKQWKWDPTLQNAGSPPTEPVVLALSKCMTLTYTDRFTIEVAFKCEGATCRLDLGMKLKRLDSYLDHADRMTSGPHFGKLIPQIEHRSLQQRQHEFSLAMSAKRSLLNPKSENLSDKVSHIVAGLEKSFDGYSQEHHTTRYLEPEWKTQSLNMTLGEIPRMPLTGTETGKSNGFGDTLYLDSAEFREAEGKGQTKCIPSHLLDPRTGSFLGDVEVRNAVRRVNPLLERTGVLNSASGRYCEDLVVPGGAIHALNPTGKKECLRAELPVVRSKQLESFVASCPASQLVVCVCLREDDRQCRSAASVAGVVNGMLQRGLVDMGGVGEGRGGNGAGRVTPSGDYDPETAGVRMVRVDMAESRWMITKYRVKTVPFVLMFVDGRTVYAGTLGGEALKIGRSANPWKTLLVEPHIESQRRTESVLRKHARTITWDLCMTAAEAAVYKQRLAESESEYELVLVSDHVPDQDVALLERVFKGTRALIVGIATVTGEQAYSRLAKVQWAKGNMYTHQTSSLLPDRLASAAEVAVTRPFKALQVKALDELLRARFKQSAGGMDKSEELFIGLTPQSFIRAIQKALSDAKKGKFVGGGISQLGSTQAGCMLSSQETSFRGTVLQKGAASSTSR